MAVPWALGTHLGLFSPRVLPQPHGSQGTRGGLPRQLIPWSSLLVLYLSMLTIKH